MAKKYAFLFPGQGAQAQGMIKDICEAYPEAQKVVDEASKIAGKDVAKLLWDSKAGHSLSSCHRTDSPSLQSRLL